MRNLFATINQHLNHPDFAKLLLRVSFSVMIMFHGSHKIYGDTLFIQSLLTAHGLPAFIAYGVYLGEIIAPALIILGIWSRIWALIVVMTCVVIVYLNFMPMMFALGQNGEWAMEPVAVYLFSFLTMMFAGSGKYAIKPD